MSAEREPEPECTGKVILRPSHGPLEIDLWCRETPETTRNFIQLCLEGYYEECPFHRIVPGFILQTGDPFGNGGESTLDSGSRIKSEWHPRLKFNRRGLVGMVKMPAEDSKSAGGASQFFNTTSVEAIFGISPTKHSLTRSTCNSPILSTL